MAIPGVVVIALSSAALLSVYVCLMAPLDERLPRELRDAKSEEALRDVKRRFRRSWILRTPVMFIAGTVPIGIDAVFAHTGVPGFADPSVLGRTILEVLEIVVAVSIVGVLSGWLWAHTQIRLALIVAKGLDAEPLESGKARSARWRVVGLLLGGVAVLGTAVLALAGSGLINTEAATGILVGAGAGGGVLALGLWRALRPRGDGLEDWRGR